MEKLSPEQIRTARERLGLSQRELAQRVGVSQTSIDKYEQGSTPKPEHARKLREVLFAPPDNSDGRAYLRHLEENDRFFKHQYTAFNTQVLANLTALQTMHRNAEALLKISLQRLGNIEAWQRGLPPAAIQDEINIMVLNAGIAGMGNGADNQRTGL